MNYDTGCNMKNSEKSSVSPPFQQKYQYNDLTGGFPMSRRIMTMVFPRRGVDQTSRSRLERRRKQIWYQKKTTMHGDLMVCHNNHVFPAFFAHFVSSELGLERS